ncbi:sodium:proline symporter [Actinomycetota bacterium]|nr:sodium:proline symporter [Actinomycetota bacterium]
MRVKTNKDYILGSRGLGPLAGALSAEAADMSAWLFMGLPGSIYLAGTGKGWIAVGLLAGTIANWVFVARKIRSKSIDLDDAQTLPQFFSRLTTTNSIKMRKALQIVVSLIIVLFFTIYTASGFVAGAKFFSFIFQMPYFNAMCITALVVAIYTFLGGFLSISWNSVVQGLLMLLSVVVVPISALIILGGLTELTAVAPAPTPTQNSAVDVISSLAWGLGYFGMPHIIIKYMAIKSEQSVKRGGVIAVAWCAISLGFAVLIGEVGRAFFRPDSANALDAKSAENVFTMLIDHLFIQGEALNFPFLGGLFYCAILAAIMSTAASQLLMASSSLTSDIYAGIFNPRATDKFKLWMSRVVVILVAVVAFVIAQNPDNSIMELVANAWAGFGAAFGPLVLLGLYSKRVTAVGALAGMVVGVLTILAFPFLNTGLYELVPGFLLSLIVIYLVSKVPHRHISQ